MAKKRKDDEPEGAGEQFTLETLPEAGKIRNASALLNREDPSKRVRLIIKVRMAGYVPPNVVVRTRIDPYLFTAESTVADLRTLADDPQVESIEIAEVVKPISSG